MLTRKMPKRPSFTITPDISAEIWDGATGSATGSQPCSGTKPARRPKPQKLSRKTREANPPARWCSRSAANSSEPLSRQSSQKAISTSAMPIWFITK